MLCDELLTEESVQRRAALLRTVDAPSDYIPGQQETTTEDWSALSKLGPAGCRAGGGPQRAVWSCSGCGEPIREPVVLRVGSDQRWHPGCLCCDECQSPLAGSASCFLRDGRTFCREDYIRMFAEKCAGCGEAVLATDLVVRAGRLIYHPGCLRCCLCGALLMPGCSFTLGPGGPCCQARHAMPERQNHKVDTLKKKIRGSQTEERGGIWRRWPARGRGVRTVLSAAQLRALRCGYSQTPRPGAMFKLRLSQQTGLSLRVIRVWFQNERCKDKKNRAKRGSSPAGELSQTAVQHRAARPMVVVSPEPPASAIQITIYESPWQLLDSPHKPSVDRGDLLLTDRLQSSSPSDDLDPTAPAK